MSKYDWILLVATVVVATAIFLVGYLTGRWVEEKEWEENLKLTREANKNHQPQKRAPKMSETFMYNKNSTPTSSPTPASMRAAEAICNEYDVGTSSSFCDDPPDWDPADEKDIAQIIDAQTGVKELEWLNSQIGLSIYISTKLVGDEVRIFDGHRFLASGKTIQEAAVKAQQAPRNAERK